MGSSSYRWFLDGCCECVGRNCVNYGLNESKCLNCPLKTDREEEAGNRNGDPVVPPKSSLDGLGMDYEVAPSMPEEDSIQESKRKKEQEKKDIADQEELDKVAKAILSETTSEASDKKDVLIMS